MDKGEVIVLTVELSSEMRMTARARSEVELADPRVDASRSKKTSSCPAGDDHAIFETVLVTGPLP
jgi:hypothetical protein